MLVTAEGGQHEGGVGMGVEKYRDGPATVATQPNECAVYFVCDVDACVPTEAEWPAVYAEDKAWRKAKAEGVALDLAAVAEAAAKAQTEKHGVDKGKKQAVRSTLKWRTEGRVWEMCVQSCVPGLAGQDPRDRRGNLNSSASTYCMALTDLSLPDAPPSPRMWNPRLMPRRLQLLLP